MKRFSLCLLILISTSISAWSQVEWTANFGIGKSNNAVEIPGLIGSNPEPDPLTNFYLGIGFRAALGSKLAINPELLFTQRGNSVNAPIGEARTVADYLTLPVWVEYEAVSRLHLRGGFEFGYVLSQRLKTSNQSAVDENNDIGQRTDIGLQAGFRYEVGKRINIDLRYVWGLVNQYRPYYISSLLIAPNDEERYIPLTNENSVQRSFQIGLSYVLFQKD